MSYKPRQMPARYMAGAPEIVRAQVLDLIHMNPASPLDYDVILRPEADSLEIAGIDFGRFGDRGQHFYLSPYEARDYRARNRRRRVAWSELPAPTQRAIVAYLES